MTSSLGIVPQKENRAVTTVPPEQTRKANVDVYRRTLHTGCYFFPSFSLATDYF